MIRFLVIRFVLPLLALLLVRSLLRSVFSGFRTYTATQSQRPAQATTAVPAGGELKKDPVCGTYVSTQGSITRSVDGKLIHFCSAQCRDKYRVA